MGEQAVQSDRAASGDRPPGPRRRRKSRLLVATVLVIGWVVLLGIWFVLGRSASWRGWLANVEFSRSASAHSGAAKGTPSFLGHGKADLGSYSVRIFDPAGRTTLRTDFRLQGRTVCKDQASFDEFIGRHHRFFREQVMVTLRNCDLEDLADPRFRLLEKKLVSRVNRALGRRFLRSAEIEDFSLYEAVGQSGFVERNLPDRAAVP